MFKLSEHKMAQWTRQLGMYSELPKINAPQMNNTLFTEVKFQMSKLMLRERQ